MLKDAIRHIDAAIADACERSGRRRSDVAIVAVTKTVEADHINEALGLGLDIIGENRVQEYLRKRPLLSPHRFHMIGTLQRNKVRQIIDVVELIHSVDRLDLAAQIDAEAQRIGRTVRVLLEVNTSGEASKHGVPPEQVSDTIGAMLTMPHLTVDGLMTIGALLDDAELVRPCFRTLQSLHDDLRRMFPTHPFPHLSMGMSNDVIQAVEEGATLVRLGTALFGHRG